MAAPELEPVGLHLARVAKTVSRAFDEALAEAGGSVPVWLILVSVKGSAHGAQRGLAEAVGVEGPTLTHHLNRMERAGLVTRRRDPDNRRVHHVELTARGEELFFALLERVVAFDERLRAEFSERDLAQLRRLLDRLVASATAPRLVGGGLNPIRCRKAAPAASGVVAVRVVALPRHTDGDPHA